MDTASVYYSTDTVECATHHQINGEGVYPSWQHRHHVVQFLNVPQMFYDMDDKKILDILSAMPDDRCVEEAKLVEFGITEDIRLELIQLNLIIGKVISHHGNPKVPPVRNVYWRSVSGSDWITNYHRQNRNKKRERWMVYMTCVILLLTLLAATAALPTLWNMIRCILHRLL